MTRLPRKIVLSVYLTVLLFAFGQCKQCYFLETNQTIDKCQLSDWFAWDCLCCGSDVLQQTLAMRNRGMCCPVGVDSNTCKRECNFHTATSEQGLCADHCSHLTRPSRCSISKDATTQNPTVYLTATSETTNKIPHTRLNGMPTATSGGSVTGPTTISNGGPAIGTTTSSNSGPAIGLTTSSNGGSAIGPTTSSNGGSAIGLKTSSNGGSVIVPTTSSNGGSAIILTTSSNGGSAIRPTTSSNGGSAIGTMTSSNGGPAIRPTTSSNGGSAIGPTTSSNGGSATGLTTSSNGGSVIGPTTSSNGGSAIGSTTSSNGGSVVKSTSLNDESTLNDKLSQNSESSNFLNGGVSYAEDGNNYCYIVTMKVPVFTNTHVSTCTLIIIIACLVLLILGTVVVHVIFWYRTRYRKQVHPEQPTPNTSKIDNCQA